MAKAHTQEYPQPPFPAQAQGKPGLESKMRPLPEYQAPQYKAAGKLEGKVALITGGDSGIGRAVAVLYAREGANVAIVYLPAEQSDAEETRAAVEQEGAQALLLPGDVTEPNFCREAVKKTVAEFGQLDILVNNAATQQTHDAIEEISDEEWEFTFRTNIFGYFYMSKAALAHMRPRAVIINTSSITGLEGNEHLHDSSFHEGRGSRLHEIARAKFGGSQDSNELRGSRFYLDTAPPLSKPAEKVSMHGADTAMKRPGQPEEVAPAYVFFASEADSSYITGEVLALLGGDTTAA